MKPLALAATAALFAFAPLARAEDPPPPAAPATPAAPAAPAEKHGLKVNIGGATDGDSDPSAAISNLPPDVRARLNGEQIEDILRRSQDAHTANVASTLVPGIFFLTIIAIVVAVLMGRHRRERVLHETLRAMIEKGAEIPRELLGVEKKKTDDRRRGIILIGAGLGLGSFLFVVDGSHGGAWAFGLVPLLVGAGYLLAWVLERRDRAA